MQYACVQPGSLTGSSSTTGNSADETSLEISTVDTSSEVDSSSIDSGDVVVDTDSSYSSESSGLEIPITIAKEDSGTDTTTDSGATGSDGNIDKSGGVNPVSNTECLDADDPEACMEENGFSVFGDCDEDSEGTKSYVISDLSFSKVRVSSSTDSEGVILNATEIDLISGKKTATKESYSGMDRVSKSKFLTTRSGSKITDKKISSMKTYVAPDDTYTMGIYEGECVEDDTSDAGYSWSVNKITDGSNVSIKIGEITKTSDGDYPYSIVESSGAGSFKTSGTFTFPKFSSSDEIDDGVYYLSLYQLDSQLELGSLIFQYSDKNIGFYATDDLELATESDTFKTMFSFVAKSKTTTAGDDSDEEDSELESLEDEREDSTIVNTFDRNSFKANKFSKDEEDAEEAESEDSGESEDYNYGSEADEDDSDVNRFKKAKGFSPSKTTIY